MTNLKTVVRHGKTIAALACFVLAAAVTNCKHNESAGGTGSSSGQSAQAGTGMPAGISVDGGKSYAHVSYKPEVKVLEAAQIDSSLEGISTDGQVLVFRNTDPQIRAMKEGDILFVKNQMVRKVVAAQTQGDETSLLTDTAAITDVVQDGEIHLDTPLNFHGSGLSSQNCMPRHDFFDLLGEPAYAQGVLPCWAPDDAAAGSVKSVIGSLISGWTITTWQVTPGSNTLDFHLVMTKNVQGFVAMVAMKGSVSNFNFTSNINVVRGAGQKMFTGVKNMSGKIQFDWEIGKGSPGVWAVEDRIKLPAGITIPLGPMLGGMPLSLDISSALLIHPALTGGDELSRGGFTVTWTGGGNFTSQAGATPSGDSDMQLTFEVTKDTNVSPIAPNGMVISYCAPRLELKFDVFGDYANKLCSFASGIVGLDKIAKLMEIGLPASLKQSMAANPLSKITAGNVLSSKADIYVQFITTEGVTHSSNQTLAPCSKQEIKLTCQGGGEAQLMGVTKGMAKTTDLFTKTFTRWDPASDFCKKVSTPATCVRKRRATL